MQVMFQIINSSSMKRVLTGVSPAHSSDTTDDPFVWSSEKQVLSSLQRLHKREQIEGLHQCCLQQRGEKCWYEVR